MIGQAIQTIGNLIQGRSDRKQSEINQNRTIQANKNMAEYQYSKDLEMWNRGNQYNTPEAQMQRLEKAGLNKNMVYGQGTVSGNTTGQLPKYQAPRIEHNQIPNQIGNVIGQYQDMKMKSAQIDSVRQQALLTEQQRATELIKQGLGLKDQERRGYQNTILGELAKYSFQNAHNITLRQAALADEAWYKSEIARKTHGDQIDTISHLERIKRNEADWADQGMRSTDTVPWRIVNRISQYIQSKWKNGRLEF